MHNKQAKKQQRDGKKLIKHRSGASYSSGQECKKFSQMKNHLKIRLPIRTTSRVRNTIKMARRHLHSHPGWLCVGSSYTNILGTRNRSATGAREKEVLEERNSSMILIIIIKRKIRRKKRQLSRSHHHRQPPPKESQKRESWWTASKWRKTLAAAAASSRWRETGASKRLTEEEQEEEGRFQLRNCRRRLPSSRPIDDSAT